MFGKRKESHVSMYTRQMVSVSCSQNVSWALPHHKNHLLHTLVSFSLLTSCEHAWYHLHISSSTFHQIQNTIQLLLLSLRVNAPPCKELCIGKKNTPQGQTTSTALFFLFYALINSFKIKAVQENFIYIYMSLIYKKAVMTIHLIC